MTDSTSQQDGWPEMIDSTQMMLRKARHEDAAQISSCVKKAYSPYLSRMGVTPAPALENYSEVIRDREVWVAEALGMIRGVLVLMQTADGFLLDNVAVSPEAHGQGLGRRLLQLAEMRAWESGYHDIYLYTNTAMRENLELYSRIGYCEYDRRLEGEYSRVYLRKRLAPNVVGTFQPKR